MEILVSVPIAIDYGYWYWYPSVMPTVTFVSPKGGAGKTTSAVLLACEIAKAGKAVTILDADPNKPVCRRWVRMTVKRLGKVPENLSIVAHDPNSGDQAILDEIGAAEAATPFVIVDLEGTASLTVVYAITKADLVLIPSQGSPLDGEQAARAIMLVRKQEELARRKIPHAVLMTRVSAAITSRTLQHVLAELGANAPVMQTRLVERDAFKSIFDYGGSLCDLDAKLVPGLPKAVANSRAFSAEVINVLRNGLPGQVVAEVA